MAEAEFKYDVFVSYSSANKEWVRKIFVPILEKAGLKVCDYYRDFDVGAPIVMEMERAILESRKTIPVLSPAYLKSGWTEFESLMFQTLDAANRNRRVLPVIFETCELPLRIKYMNCINFANPDDIDIEWERLSRALEVTLSPSLIESKLSTGSRDTWHLAHPYPMPPNFTGRAAEQKMLDDWLADDTNRLFILRALGGFGKSALAWQWINTHVNPAEWTKLVWWSFYEGDASFEHFIEETLKYLKLDVPQGQRPQVDELLKAMQGQKILLIMDGFERALRLYGNMNAVYQDEEEQKIDKDQLTCKDINSEWFLRGLCSLPNMKSKVLMTTRLTPHAIKPRGEYLQGCREVELIAMQKADAIEFFYKQKIQGIRAEIEGVCASYGYHPLSLRILAGLIINDRESPGDIEVAKKLDITDDIIQNKNHVLKISYKTLSFAQQKLLSNIACFRSSINYQALKFITSKPSWKRKNRTSLNEKLDDSLQTLESRGLLNWDRHLNKYDLHPLVRRYAYERLTAPDRTAAHSRLRDYFASVKRPAEPQTLDDLVPVLELYHHTVCAEKYDDAAILFFKQIDDLLYYRFGAYQIMIELLRVLFPDGENQLPRLRNERQQSKVLTMLGNSYGEYGQPRNAISVYQKGFAIREKLGQTENVGIILGAMVMVAFLPLGMLREAEKNLQLLISLGGKTKDKFNEARGHLMLGLLLTYKSDFNEAAKELDIAHKLFEEEGYIQSVGLVWSHRAISAFLSGDKPTMENAAKMARKLADEEKYERDILLAEWLLGSAYRLDNKLGLAEQHLTEALTRDRAINLVQDEANILLDLARLRYDQKNYEEAKSLADEALVIAERCGYVLQGADVNLFLATLALEGHTLERFKFDGKRELNDKEVATLRAKEALKLATCDGPPYYYKVAYEEAERFLEQLAG